MTDDELAAAVADVLAPADTEEERQEKLAAWDPVDLLVPEWRYLQKPSLFPQQQNSSGLMVTETQRGPTLHPNISRVVAVNQMKKVNAVLGFTRLDEMDRVNDLASRLVKLTRDGRPRWVPATEDRGEGIFLQLDLDAVATWEQTILGTSAVGGPPPSAPAQLPTALLRDSQARRPRHPPARPPVLAAAHVLAHADPRDGDVLRLRRSQPHRTHLRMEPRRRNGKPPPGCSSARPHPTAKAPSVASSPCPSRADCRGSWSSALRRAARCSSDPVCAMRTPSDPEDFLHGAACHCCTFASETSCEKANRFLDRRFLLTLPSATGDSVPGFFGSVDAF